jgi:murein DD-endopeptidase MepM/ murein hydrolase activator NlpD
MLASRLGMDEKRLWGLLTEEGLPVSDDGECIPYVAATGGEGGAASATFQRMEPENGKPPIVAVRKTEDGVTVTPGACDCPEPIRRVLTVPSRDITDLSNEVMASTSRDVLWQLEIVVPQMIAGLSLERAAGREAGKAPVDDPYTVRVVLERLAENEPEHLESIELNDTATGKRLDGVWWLDRPGGPGVFIGMEGLAYERLLWQSPVKYVVKSRGVGPGTTTVRQRVKAPKGSAKATVLRYVKIRRYHLGADLMAAKGTEVNAVGDATVTFAGRQGGFGNLIILDHGRGYQTYYAHLSVIGRGIKPGVSVSRGEVIGLVGSTGHSTAPHLHFETRKDGKYLDPFDDTRQLGFWLLTADDQERLAMELLATDGARVADRPERRESPVGDLSFDQDGSTNDNR